MKIKCLFVFSVILCLLACAASADKATREDVVAAAGQDYPGWTVTESSWYGSGKWNGEMAQHLVVNLVKLEDGRLLLKDVEALLNPLQTGDPIPWEVTDYPPLPLDEETVQRAGQLDLKTVNDPFDGNCIDTELLPGCAAFMLPEGAAWEQLFVHPQHLVGIANCGQDAWQLVIAHWDGTAFDRTDVSPVQHGSMGINGIHSWDGDLELNGDYENEYYIVNADGQWRLQAVNTGAAIYYIKDGYITDTSLGWYENNENYMYGDCRLPVQLEALNLAAFEADWPAWLDTAAFACTAHDDTPMYDAPGGVRQAGLYTRVAGRITAEQGDWVQLHIGERGAGFDGWFRREDLCFGDAVNSMQCGFPTPVEQRNVDMDVDDLLAQAMGLDPEEDEDHFYQVWVIGQDSEGRWMFLVDHKTLVCIHPVLGMELGECEHYDIVWDMDDEEEEED